MSLSIGSKPRAYRQANHSNVVTSVAFAPDGRTLASGSWDGTIKLWDVDDGKPKLKRTLRGQWDEVEAVAFSPDGTAIAGLGTGFEGAPFGVVTLWMLETARGRPLIHQSRKIDTLAFAPDGRTLATGSGDCHAVTLWDVATGQERAILPNHSGPIRSIAYSPAGHCLAVASGVVPAFAEWGGTSPVGEICLWNLATEKPGLRARLSGHTYGAIAVAFSPDGANLVSGGFDRVVKIWDVEAGSERATHRGHEGWVAAVAFAPDSTMLATGSHDQTVKLWDMATGRQLATLSAHTGNVYAVAFSPDGELLASGSLDGTVRLWDVARVLSWGSQGETVSG